MIDYIKEAISSIMKEISGNNQNNMYILYGDEGIGKTTIAKAICEIRTDVLCFNCSNELELASMFLKINPKKNYDRHLYLYKPLIKKIKKGKISTLIFDVESDTSEDYFDLIYDIFVVLNQQNHPLDIIIFIDNRIYHSYHELFSKYQKLSYLTPLRKWQTCDFFQLWQEWYDQNSTDKETLELIASYSISNASIFLKHLNTLKFFNYLVLKDNMWIFEKQEHLEEILKEEYSVIVQKKYESLIPELQTVIKQTSTIGYIFNRSTLKEVFEIKNAQMILKQIELLTKLLYYTDSEMENGRFDSEVVQQQIENLIEPKLLTVWCKALAEYYESKIKSTGFISLERCALKEKAIFYYTKSNIIEKIIYHYLSAIPLKCNLGQYNSAIEMSKKLIFITKDLSQYNWVYSYCFYMMAFIYKSLANYTEALICLQKYIKLVGKETIETKEFKAELLYDIGNTIEALHILKSLYRSRNQIDDPSLKINIISMLSSIEETINDSKYIKHFNEALEIAKNNKLNKEFYQLLRKANLAHSGENGIMLMETAEKYFSCNNIISELIMAEHNIGTESLFYESTFKNSFNKLNSAYKAAREIGFSQLTYISNSFALYYILKSDFKTAVSILNYSLTFHHEDFTLLALLLNKATCLRRLGSYSDALYCLNKARQLNSKEGNQFPFFNAQIIVQSAYLYMEQNDYYNTYLGLLEYLNLDLDNRDANIASVKIVLKELCDMQKIKYPPEINASFDDWDSIAKTMANNHLVLCELMFWE